MFGRCCPRPRPCGRPMPRPMCGGMMPMMAPVMPTCPSTVAPGPVLPFGGACQTVQMAPQVVVEPALMAAPNVFHHHQKVEHIQPVITQDIHHIHTHHNYVVQEQKKCDEVVNHSHGLCGPATTQPAQPCCPAPVSPCGR